MKALLVAALSAVAALWWCLGDRLAVEPPAATCEMTQSTTRVESGAFDDWLPTLRSGAEVTFTNRSSVAPDGKAPVERTTHIATVRTLGPLSASELGGCRAALTQLAERRFASLAVMPVCGGAGVSFELLLQAEELANAEEALAAAEALAQGDYFTSEPGHVPPAPPNAGFVQLVAKLRARSVVVSIVMPFDRYRRFGDAWRYKTELAQNYPAYLVGEWNVREEAWRRSTLARCRRIEQATTRSREDQAFLRRWSPTGVGVDELNALLVLQ